MNILEQLQQNRWMIWAKEEEPLEEYPQVQLISICYRSDDCEVRGYAAAPKEAQGPLPAVIFNRGGNREFSLLRPQVVCKYANQGFVVLGSQYRGNGGGTGQEEFGGADVNDVIRLIDIALELPETLKGGVYMAGHSRGGMMTYRCCALDDRIVAASIGAGVADCVDMYNRREDSMKQVFLELVGARRSSSRRSTANARQSAGRTRSSRRSSSVRATMTGASIFLRRAGWASSCKSTARSTSWNFLEGRTTRSKGPAIFQTLSRGFGLTRFRRCN